MTDFKFKETYSLDDLLEIMKILRSPSGCPWDMEQTHKSIKNDFIEDHSKYIVAKVNNEIVGFAGIKIILDEADIMNIVTRVDKRGNGIGSLLLGNLINLASLLNCTCINLEVNENNDPAIHLYEKYSFARIGLRKKYYNNTDNAILMKKEL